MQKMILIIFNAPLMILLLLPHSRQTILRVNTCPSNKQSWEQRSKSVVCEDTRERYHCIQTNNQTLIETCMIPYVINSYKDGCPWVQISDGKVFLGNPFNPCEARHGRCPENNHQKYRTNQLYLYPACIKFGDIACIVVRNSTECPIVMPVHNIYYGSVNPVLITITAIFFCIIVGLLICLVRKRRARNGSHRHSIELETSPEMRSSTEIQEERNGNYLSLQNQMRKEIFPRKINNDNGEYETIEMTDANTAD